jgi:hypothetical protein
MLKSRNHNVSLNKHHYLMVVVFVVALIALPLVLLIPSYQTPPTPIADIKVPEVFNLATSSVYNSSEPVQLDIPAIELSAPFTDSLGLASNGEISVPETYTDVGWYKFSPTPGELGPSVILGHVDSYTGPAVFWSLGKVSLGDEIHVTRADGSVVTFEVEGLERYPQADFPTEKVYGNITYAGLRLITCSGTYNKGAKRYTHNLVVYAKLK